MNVGNRLNAVISLLSSENEGGLFADIGSDHAFLAIEVIRRGIFASAIASDINSMPLEKGRENAKSFGADIEFILSDGFDAFDDRRVSAAAICGMGGELISGIILRSKIARSALLILQPMSAQEYLRKALWDNGFTIFKEQFVIDQSKPYTVMKVRFTGVCEEYGVLDLYLGKERKSCTEFSSYCERQLIAAQKRRIGLVARGLPTSSTDELIEFCQTQVTSF